MNAVTGSRALAALLLTIALPIVVDAPRARGDQAAPGGSPAPSTDTSSPVSATGLLPIFGVGIDFDALPDKAKSDDAVASVQKLWDSYLKGAGFNVIQFPVDVKELGDKGAARLAKLCVWAKAKNVRLAPALIGAAPGEALPADYPDKVGAFAAKTIELVGKNGDPQAYSQIMVYQIERPLNHPASHGPMEAPQAAEMLSQAVAKLHAAEQTALAGTSLQATPVLASVSFDYELIRFGAIANVPITDESYQQAYESLKGYLGTVLSSAPIDVIGLEWFPGSVSADAVDRFPDMISKLQADFPGKLLIVGTGYSTAVGGESDQSKYYTQTFNNLSDLRATQGVESSFAGILWRTAMDRPGGEPQPPSSKTAEEMAKWNWSERAAEVTRMWNEPGSDSKEMRWWLGRVESHFGLLGAGKDISKPGAPKASYQLLSHLMTSLTAAAEATGAGAIAKELSSQGSVKGVAGAMKDKLQAALFGMLDVWIAKTAENLVSGGGSSGGSGDGGGGAPPPAPPNLADLQIQAVGEVTTEIKAGTLLPLSITMVNAGTAPATNVVLYLREGASTDLANSTPTTISPGGSTVVNLPWTSAHPGNFHDVTLDAYCDNEGDASSNHASLGDVPVSPGGGGGGGDGGGHGGIGGMRGVVIDSPALAGLRAAMSTKTDPGFVQIQAVRSINPVPMMKPMSAPGSGGGMGGGMTMIGGGASLPVLGGGGTGGTGTGGTQSTTMAMTMGGAPSGPQPMSLAFSVTNPFDHNFTSVKGTLKVDNKVVATKDLGVLFPRQRRTVNFAQWTPPKPGTFPVRIELTGLGLGGRPLSATAMDQIVVAPPSKAAKKSGPGGAPGGTSTRSLIIGGTGAPGGVPGGSTPMMMQTRLMTPMLLVPAQQQAGGPKTRSLLLTPGGRGGPAFAPTLLGLTANSIVLAPFPALAGNEVELSVRLFNSERLPASKVKVEAFVDGDKLGETTMDAPVARAVLAKGFKKWTAKPGRHEVRAVVTWGSRSGAAAKPIDVRPPNGVGAGGVAALVGRGSFAFPRLTVTANDVRLNPLVPSAGSSVELSVRVQNAGAGDVKGVRAELFADGVRLGEANGDIAAGKDRIFTGYPRWTPTAGKHVILCRATAGGQITEASREVTVGAGITLMKPLLTTTTMTTNPTIGMQTAAMSGMTLAIAARPDLQILAGDITFAPAAPKANDPLTITIVVRNLGNALATGGMVTGVLQADGAEVGRRQFPAAVAANGSMSLIWPVTTPAGKVLTAIATSAVANDSRADNNEGRASASIATVIIFQPQLELYRR